MKVSKETKQKIAKALRKDPDVNRTKLAEKYGVSRGTVFIVAQNINAVLAPVTIDAEAKILAQREQVKEYKALYNASMKKIGEVQRELNVFRNFEQVKDLIVPLGQEVIEYTGRKQAVPVLVVSDWHVDEPVDPASIGGLNEYNLAIARDRISRLIAGTVKIIGMLKSESDINELVVAVLGDMMSGWIHDELQVANEVTPMEAILEVINMMTGLLDNLLDAGIVKRITVVACVGNHARITAKTFYKKRVATSYEWMIYNMLMQHYAAKGETRIKFQIPTGYFNWMRICGRDIRCHHGDNMRYNGGIGGIHIPVKKAIAQWNKGRHADLDLFGHWHTLEWAQDYVINGSLIGYNAFGEMLKVDYQPAAQALFLMHARFGKTAQYPIVVQDDVR